MESIKVFHSEAGLFQTITAWWLTALEQPKDRSREEKETERSSPLYRDLQNSKGAKIRTQAFTTQFGFGNFKLGLIF